MADEELITKARKAKGLGKWNRLQDFADKLAGKDVSAISFTCSHPTHSGSPVKHLLGSVEGNLHFLLGYGNPRFHFAPYHIQILDPNVSDEEAEQTFSRIGHPSNPALWSKSELDVGDEGDQEEGKPHPAGAKVKVKQETEARRKKEAVGARSPTGMYIGYPSEELVVGVHNNHHYKWDLVQDTFFSAQNPELTEAMEEASIKKSLEAVVFKESAPSEVIQYSKQYKGEAFDAKVWSLVKSRVPRPGTVVRFETSTAETLYGVVTPTCLEFFQRNAEPAEVQVFDRVYKSFDLTRDGNVPPAALLRLVVNRFQVNTALLEAATASTTEAVLTKSYAVEGEPSPGFELVPSEYSDELVKSVVQDGDTWRLVVSL